MSRKFGRLYVKRYSVTLGVSKIGSQYVILGEQQATYRFIELSQLNPLPEQTQLDDLIFKYLSMTANKGTIILIWYRYSS